MPWWILGLSLRILRDLGLIGLILPMRLMGLTGLIWLTVFRVWHLGT